MAGFAYQAMGLGDADTAMPMNNTVISKDVRPIDVGECLDLLTCVCYLLPCDSVWHDDAEELPSSNTASPSEDKSVDEKDDCGMSCHSEESQGLMADAVAKGGYDLAFVGGEPPRHFAMSDRHYGMCPLGHQETIYFKKVTA